MKRKNVHITEQQDAQLSQIAKNSGLTVAEHIRRAIDAYIERSSGQAAPAPSKLNRSPASKTQDTGE